MSDWKEVELGEVVEVLDFKRIPVKRSERRPGPYPYYGASGIADYINDYIFEGLHLLIAEDGDNLRTRNTPIAFLADGKFWVNNHAHIVRGTKRSDTRYLGYWFNTLDISPYLSGSTRPKLNQSSLRRIKVRLPPIHEQEAIASTLGVLDDKIQLNHQTARTLEELVQCLFKSWFVDFNPVRAKMAGSRPAHTPPEIADLFPDRLVDSPLGPIPEGWENRSLQEIAELDTTSVKPASEPGEEWKHYSIPAFDSGQTPLNELGASIKSGKYRVKPASVLVSKLNPSEWRAWLPDSDAITTRSICSTEFMQFVVQDAKHRAFIWGLANSAPFRAGVMKTVSGTTGSRQRAQPKQVKQLVFGTPDEKLLSAYADIVMPMLDRKAGLLREVETLSKLRDRLLPKLISGEIRVPEALELAKESVL